MNDPRLNPKIPEIREENLALARVTGEELARSSPDHRKMRLAIEKGCFYSTRAFVLGFVEALTESTRAAWSAWLFEGLGERGAICEAHGISAFLGNQPDDWLARRNLEPWETFSSHTGHWGSPRLVPAQLLASASRELWHKRLDEISVPSLLLWMSAAGDGDAPAETWLSDLKNAPACFQGKRPTGEMRALAIIRHFVEHCESLEQAIAGQGDASLVKKFREEELVRLGAQLCDVLSTRADAQAVLAHTVEHLARKQLFALTPVARGNHEVPALLTRTLSRKLLAIGSSTRTFKQIDGAKRQGRRRWIEKSQSQLSSTPSEQEIPEGEGDENDEEVNGLTTWMALAALHSESAQGSARHLETWEIFTALLERRDQGFSRLDHYPDAHRQIAETAGRVLSKCPDPHAAWMNAYSKTEPQRRRGGFPHRYVDISVGIPTSVLLDVGAIAAFRASERGEPAGLYDTVEQAARRMWLTRPGGHRMSWEDQYARVLAHCVKLRPTSISRLMDLLAVGINSPTLVCTTLEYCLEKVGSPDLLTATEERFEIRLDNMIADADVLNSWHPERYPLLRRSLQTKTSVSPPADSSPEEACTKMPH